MSGEIVGVNEISMGLAGAIPSDLAREVSEAIIRDGRVERSWLGLDVQPLLKAPDGDRGALVSGTIEGSPAEKAGFQSGDVLLQIDGHDVNVRFAEEMPLFNQMVMRLPLGKPIEAKVKRNGSTHTLRVVAEDRESVEAPVRELPLAGITASNLTGWTAKELNRASRDGVRVHGVRPGGPAGEAKPELQRDDVILQIEGHDVKSVEDLEKAIERLTGKGEGPVPALISFERGRQRMLSVLDIGRATLEDPGREARKAWVPVSVQVLTPALARELELGDRTGVRITRIIGSSAGTAGLKVGDVITKVDDDPVEASQPSDADLFATMIRQYKIGSSVRLTLLREGQEQVVAVSLEPSPPLPREMKKYEDPNFEFRVRDITAFDRAERNWPEAQPGVLVEAVREGGWAALGHLADGDLLLAIDGEPVKDVETVQARMTKIAESKPETVVLRVRRGIRTLFVEMQTGWE
jgi:serine protease Do